MGTDPSTCLGLAIDAFAWAGVVFVVVLCRQALRNPTEFEGEVKGPWFSLRLKTRQNTPDSDGDRDGNG
jgi:hypothetical protein